MYIHAVPCNHLLSLVQGKIALCLVAIHKVARFVVAAFVKSTYTWKKRAVLVCDSWSRDVPLEQQVIFLKEQMIMKTQFWVV